jgi:hypothetical protein
MDLYLTEPIILFVVGFCWLAPIVTYAKYTTDAGILKSNNLYLFIIYLAILFFLWYFISHQVYSRTVFNFVRAEVVRAQDSNFI